MDKNKVKIMRFIEFRFRPLIVKKCIHDVMSEFFLDKQYDANEAPKWAKELGDAVKIKLKGEFRLKIANSFIYFFASELELERYKFIVQVVIGEQRGEGVK